MAKQIVITPVQHESISHALIQAQGILDVVQNSPAADETHRANALWAAHELLQRVRDTIGDY